MEAAGRPITRPGIVFNPQNTPGQGDPSCVYLSWAYRSFGLIRGRVGLAYIRNSLPSSMKQDVSAK